MPCKKAKLLIILFCATGAVAQNVYDVYPERVESKKTNVAKQESKVERQEARVEKHESRNNDEKTITGFTGGMKLHIGYAFAQSPDELYHNGSLQNLNLSTDGVTMGLGGELRLHLINHIHVGGEGGMCTMPLKNGSSIRTGWGGALCDYYSKVGKVQLCAGGVVGGGTIKRLFVPELSTTAQSEEGLACNASYSETPFFLLDPYVGMEIPIANHLGLLIKLDYMLPFGKGNSGITKETIRWSNFLTPSGPRLYVGVMFGGNN